MIPYPPSTALLTESSAIRPDRSKSISGCSRDLSVSLRAAFMRSMSEAAQFHFKQQRRCPLCPVITVSLYFTHIDSSFYITHDVLPARAYSI